MSSTFVSRTVVLATFQALPRLRKLFRFLVISSVENAPLPGDLIFATEADNLLILLIRNRVWGKSATWRREAIRFSREGVSGLLAGRG